MIIINSHNPLRITTSDIYYSSEHHDATRRIGENISTNILGIKNLTYEAAYYKSKLIAIRRKDAACWTRAILNDEDINIPSFINCLEEDI